MRESFQNWLGKKQANPESLILLISACFRKLKRNTLRFLNKISLCRALEV